MIEAREDVERLYMIDRLSPGALPNYDACDNRGTYRVPLIRLEGPWDTKDFLIEELRSEVVRSILDIKEKGAPQLDPFTLVRAHEVMANRDVRLDAFLVHPDFVPLCERLVQPLFGIEAKLFSHHEVPYAEIYGLCEPDHVGVVPVQKGRPGAYRFSENVIWGRFRPRCGV